MALVVKSFIFSISRLQYLRENQGQIEEYTTYVTEQTTKNKSKQQQQQQQQLQQQQQRVDVNTIRALRDEVLCVVIVTQHFYYVSLIPRYSCEHGNESAQPIAIHVPNQD